MNGLEADMRIKLTSVIVNNQDKALAFYTDILGFVKKKDIPMGEARWLTVVSPQGPDDVELLLEPIGNPAAKTYQEALYNQGIPLTSFNTDDIRLEYERLTALGVRFTLPPTQAGPAVVATFDDTCGNLIQIHQV